MSDLEDATLRVIGQEDLTIAVRVILVLCCYVAVGSKNDEAAVCSYITRDRVESRGWSGSKLDGEWVGSRARRLGRNGGKRTTHKRRHDDGAQEQENLLHRFLRNNNKDADTSRLDALGELSSHTGESIIAATGVKERPF